MLTVSTLADTKTLPPPLQPYIARRFATLHQVYCSNGLPPLEQFSLEPFGSILVAESYSDVQDMLFEDVGRLTLENEVYFHCLWLSNNESCWDVIIPKKILTPAQYQKLQDELNDKAPLYLLDVQV